MLTNLLATVFFTITTNNWRTVATTIPTTESGPSVFAVYRGTMSHQVGEVRSNTVALVAWNGHTNEVVLESVFLRSEQRSIDLFLNRNDAFIR